MKELNLYNTLSRKKEIFKPLKPPLVGMYVCGPTVYGDPHLGHARGFMTFDILLRYLLYKGYKVRYVRNITDVGHLTDDNNDEGEDKVQKRAKLEQKEPMEISQHYTNIFHDCMDAMNMIRPGIEPQASGHIPEQIEYVQKILDKGLAYEVEGSIYFDVRKYDELYSYGKLSGRKLEDMVAGGQGRELAGQSDKRFPADFALWKAAADEHIMKWNSPWGPGFPGWHLECTVMSTKYLGAKYDIHGGGMDLIFPHHEAEVAQSNACHDPEHVHMHDEATYWIHNNMITINGQKMGKSLNNFITLEELFSGNHELLTQAFDASTIRFYILTAHYRSTLDFSNDGLIAADRAFKRLNSIRENLNTLDFSKASENPTHEEYANIKNFVSDCESFMNDDLNTAKVIARMFELGGYVNSALRNKNDSFPLSEEDMEGFRNSFGKLFFDVLGLMEVKKSEGPGDAVEGLMELVLKLRSSARTEKNWGLSDQIRDGLKELKISVKDTKEGAEWQVDDV